MIEYLNGFGRDVYFYTIIPSALFGEIYYIYFHARWGATVGKQAAGIKVVNVTGFPIGFREAFLRASVFLIFAAFTIIASYKAISQLPIAEYATYGWMDRIAKINELKPGWLNTVNLITGIWLLGEIVVLIGSKRKRSLHDFIGETVVIRKKFENFAELGYSLEAFQSTLPPQYVGGEPALVCRDCGFKISEQNFDDPNLLCPECGSILEEVS